jgi:hypothetical protein
MTALEITVRVGLSEVVWRTLLDQLQYEGPQKVEVHPMWSRGMAWIDSEPKNWHVT